LAEIVRRGSNHDCRTELAQLDAGTQDNPLGPGSVVACSCGKRWHLGGSLEQAVVKAFTGTRWLLVERGPGD
jgi:hypothetical protein